MILTTVPVTVRTPGVYTEFSWVSNAQSLVSLPYVIVVVAEAAGGAAPIGTPVQIFSEADSDAKLGVGTFCSLGCKMALAQSAYKGSGAQIWAVPTAAPTGGGTGAATETITFTGPATASGTIYPRIAGRQIPVGVNVGDSATTIAANLAAQIAAMAADLPVTAAAVSGVVTCTAVTHGVNGNDIFYDQAPNTTVPAGVTMVFAVGTAGTGVMNITDSLDALSMRCHAIVTSNHTTTDAATMIADRATDWTYNVANYRWYFLASRDSLGTAGALQAAANDFGIIIPVCEGIPRTNVEVAAAVAADWWSYTAPNANTDGDILLLEPPSGANAFGASEIESALGSGLTPLKPSGSYVQLVRLTSSQITVDSEPASDLYMDPAYARTDSWLAEQVAIAVGLGTVQATETDDLLNDVRDIVIEVDRAAETLGYIEDVTDYLPQIQAEYATDPVTRMLVTNPHTVVPPLHQTVIESVMYEA